ncbi:hypothetical protein N7448_003413 [Penicillium atrosanguineum]|uniref:Uncharacterized protein n=1 Tax=Penicillium atrosanguineum TaxID=1132637 RepID=A0A9W9H7A4_9EURO|nr:hypothetical protein N7526_009218 [Penicillium atrosanguineum]KAJ5140005.1 hypothetical protein N7448_003413 [Penicillium atrosanguineum]KAJ5315439.1 hypothetical protein N7476_005746 [Penicillium atrosanguineum]
MTIFNFTQKSYNTLQSPFMMYGQEHRLSLDTLPAELIREIADCIPTEKQVVELMATSLRLNHHLKDYICHRNMENGNRGLLWACQHGQFEACERFLELGADPNFEPLVGYTSRRILNIAAYGGHIECAQVLLLHGADPNAKDGSGDTPLFPAIENCDAPMVQMLLEMRADPNVENEHRYLKASPLEMAMDKELEVIVWLLVEKGAGLPD